MERRPFGDGRRGHFGTDRGALAFSDALQIARNIHVGIRVRFLHNRTIIIDPDEAPTLVAEAMSRYIFHSVIATVAVLALSACGDKKKALPPPEVGFVTLKPSSVPMTTELAGRVNAFQISEVRPQVAGIVRQRMFTEGSLVRAGQTLYQIDSSLYGAAVAEANANLASARASAEASRARAERLRPLAEMEAVSRQDYTDALAQSRQATAAVAQTGAQLRTARINLNFTHVPAPISGRIGRSLVTEGALVTTNQAEPLAVIQRLDPVYVDIQQSSSEVLALRRALASRWVSATRAPVRLKLEDGSEYNLTGSVEFSEMMVDAGTGTVTLRARFPNPEGLLLPGMFVRASFAQAVDSRVFLVPQPALLRDARGTARVYIVGPDNKAVLREVKTDRTSGTNWVVTSGLRGNEKLITQGLGVIKPDMPIKPVPANTPQRIAPPPAH